MDADPIDTGQTAFLSIPAVDELTPDARAAFDAFMDGDDGPPTTLDRALLASVPAFESYLGWFTMRDEIVPYLGERAFALFALSISRGFGAPYPVAFFESYLRDNGDDPDVPHVTEAEALLIEWGAAIGSHPTAIAPALAERMVDTFQPRLRHALTAFAGLMVARCVFTVVGQVKP